MGSDVNFMCDSNNVRYWKHNGGSLPINVGVSGPRNDILTIYRVIPKNVGKYDCKYFDKDGRKKISSTYLTVTSKVFNS